MALDGTATLPRNHRDGGAILRGIGRPLGLPAPLALSISERCAHDQKRDEIGLYHHRALSS